MDNTTLAHLLKVLSDPTRLRIFDLLMHGTYCNCEVASQSGLSLSLVSHHLRVLRDAEPINYERDSQNARWIC
jgi:DNA-binding transcriptional ArsR family regulator